MNTKQDKRTIQIIVVGAIFILIMLMIWGRPSNSTQKKKTQDVEYKYEHGPQN